MKRKFLILLCLVLFIVSVAGVSAAEDVNQTIIEDTNNVVSTGDTLSVSASENVNQTIDDALSVSEYVDVISAKDDGTFTALQKKIMDAPEGSTIYLENDYYYDEGFSTDGILIENEGLTIDGKGHTLNGMSKSRIFHFYSSSSSNHYAVLKNITFYNGYTESDGGALYPETNYYKRSEFDSWGEACYWNLEVNNCVFYNNAAAESGGAIYDGQLTITDSSFINNVASYNGGAIGGYSTCNGCIFINNHANNGGALSGGGSLKYCSFTNNTADDCGGAINSVYGTIDAFSCTFNSNNASKSGGAIYSYMNDAHVANSEFNNNLADCGGAIYFVCYSYSHMYGESETYLKKYNQVVEDSTFSYNVATGYGDAVYSLNPENNEHAAKLIRCIFYENSVSGAKMEDCVFKTSIVINAPDVTKDYGGPENLEITLTESGSPIANAKVNININKNDYTRTTGSDGKASMPINLNADTYIATVSYQDISTEAIVTVNKLASKTSLAYAKNSHNSVTLTASVNPSSVSGKVTFNVNGKDYPATVSGAKATYTLNNLAVGSYDAKATYQGDVNHKSSSSSNVKFTVEEYSIIVSAPDVTKYYGGDERFVVTVTDNAGKPVANEPVKVTINGQVYDRKTGDDGRTTFAINLRSGSYEATTEHDGEVITSTITVKTTVISKDVTKIFRNGTNYEASFLDKKGNKAPAGEKVSININGVFYQRTIKDDGSISFALNLEQGTYVLTMTNPVTGEEISNTVTILPNIVENKDLVKYYRNGSQFTFKLLDDKGKPAAGQKASININGVFYTRTTNDKGIATFQINLEPGTYVLTMEYKGCRVSNTVTVLSVIKSSDIKMKYQDRTRFKVTVLDGVGKPYANQNVTFNINGVFYYRTTNNDGSASLAINLMAGEYIITTTYNSLNVSNKVTIAG